MILLCSGGVDSIAALRLLKPAEAIYFNLRTQAAGHEVWVLDWAEKQFKTTIQRSYDLDRLSRWEQKNGYLPYRNGLMVTFAAMRDPEVVVAQVAEWAPDKSKRYWGLLERQLNLASHGATQGVNRRVKIRTPFAHLTKGQLLGLYCDHFGPDETRTLLQATWSCYGAGKNHCGRCSGCVQRKVAENACQIRGTLYQERSYLPTHRRLDMAVDAYRWVRDNRSVGGLVRRVREQIEFERAL